jgi:hypothetical protein
MKPMVITLLLVAAACSNEAPPQAAVQPAPAAPAPLAEAGAQKAAAVVPESRPNPDLELAARVKKALDEAASHISQGVDVAASGGVVRLFGTVASRADRRKAGQVAASIPGVTSVENKLVVVKGS